MSLIKKRQWFGGILNISNVASTPYKTQTHKVINKTTSESHTPEGGNWIEKIKTVGTISEYVVLSSLLDMEGNELLQGDTLLDESDELIGPFSYVELSATQATMPTGGSVNLIIWEYING